MALAHHEGSSARVISKTEIHRDHSSYVDPQGYLFHYDGRIYRFINAQSAPIFRGLMADGTLDRLTRELRVVPTGLSNLTIAEEAPGMVVEHDRVWPVSYCVEWCPSMLRDAGIVTLELALELVGRDLMLQDAYPWNVLYSGAEPVFVDLTSIAPVDQAAIWPAHDQYEAFFLRPLTLAAQKKGQVARALLLDNIAGISPDDFYRLVSNGYRWRHPSLLLARGFERLLQSNPKTKERVRKAAEQATAYASPAVRRRFLNGLLKRTARHSFGHVESPWDRYYADIDPAVDKQAKLGAVRALLERLKPETVLDLGCNTGVFSIEAARSGARVVSVDSSESCVETLFASARGEGLSITPLVSDVVCPTPAFGFMGRQYPSLYQRISAQTVLCLGLMHHLHITGRQSIERIVDLLDSVAERHLIFEFIGRDDANIPHLSHRRPIDYSLESVMTALGTRFRDITLEDSDRPTRMLLVCAK